MGRVRPAAPGTGPMGGGLCGPGPQCPYLLPREVGMSAGYKSESCVLIKTPLPWAVPWTVIAVGRAQESEFFIKPQDDPNGS